MQQYQITIPEPCQEKWENMTVSEKGRFCSSCTKEVIDFSRMEDREVFTTLKYAYDHQIKVCGRMDVTQLQRPIQHTTQKIRTQIAWYWKYITAVFLFSNQGKLMAQHKPATCQTPPNTNKNKIKKE